MVGMETVTVSCFCYNAVNSYMQTNPLGSGEEGKGGKILECIYSFG